MSMFNILMLVVAGIPCILSLVYGIIVFSKYASKKRKEHAIKREQIKLQKKAKEQADKDARAAEILKFMKELFGDKK